MYMTNKGQKKKNYKYYKSKKKKKRNYKILKYYKE